MLELFPRGDVSLRLPCPSSLLWQGRTPAQRQHVSSQGACLEHEETQKARASERAGKQCYIVSDNLAL